MKFGIVGVIAFVIDWGILNLLVGIFHMHNVLAATVSFIISLIFNYLASMKFVFTEQPTCVLNINGIIGNRKMSNEEITELLEYRFILLDGFASKEGKAFPSVLELADNGAINMQSIIGKCPHCGGDIRVGTRAFNCSNYSNQQAPCNFAVWRNIGGHQLSLTEAKEICEKEITSNELEMYRDDGTIYRKRLGLSPDKLQIVKI